MLRPVVFATILGICVTNAVSAEAIAVPSGQTILFHDVIAGERGPSGLTMRFRFIAPQIGDPDQPVAFDQAEPDMMHLCDTYALPRLSNIGPKVNQIIISLSDEPVEFGYMAPEVVQYFEAYRPTEMGCEWEGF
ncbi:MAG: DUF6497 family protein [Pseudoruegeria sp.]